MQKIFSSEMIYAGFFARLAAWLLDWCILFPCLSVIKLPFGVADMVSGAAMFSTAVFFRFTLKDIIQYVCVLAYFVILTYKKGGTIGKQAMNLRVVLKDGKAPDLWTVFYRESVGKFLSKISLGIGYLLIGADQEKAALHDKISDTRVIYAKKIRLYPVIQGTGRPVKPKQKSVSEPDMSVSETTVSELSDSGEKEETEYEENGF